MKLKLKISALVILVLSLFVLLLTNTGSHPEPGFQTCGGGGTIPNHNLMIRTGIYSGPCLGLPTVVNVHGRYSTGVSLVLDSTFGVLAAVSLVTIVLTYHTDEPARKQKPKKKKSQSKR